ncbi:beta/gamma crystallin domain-containing protein 1 [Pipistrellus kuhlii]|uniref:Crystallin beta-gamma domain containing 1 n=1 Tax=Pipistrellus kuhlii TaxID=59472 RepID=A0A7J7YLE9_PIPKU|nr:beta/gamma crystallin domain-containing protein 1 [Pipistrellus kuhlii]KAF6362705.1 crystallin beta-gamma domain containing 1 [Pipistrellus kuhlii]
MPLSQPPPGDPGESPPPRTSSKKHTPFHLWRSKKKQQPPPSDCGVFVPHPPSDCGVFVPHPPPAPLGEARALGTVDEGQVAQEHHEFTSHGGESQFFHTTSEVPGPLSAESRLLKKSRAQPPEENKRKPVLGKLGNLFSAGRRRNTRNGLESPTSSSAKSASPKDAAACAQLPEQREDEKGTAPSSPPEPADRCGEGFPQEQPQEPEGERAPDAHLSPRLSSRAAAAGLLCPGNESPQLEPVHSEGEPFPDATAAAAAKQLHSSLENCPGRESADTPARGPGEDASPGAAGAQEAAPGAGGVPGSPTSERAWRGPGEAADTDSGVGAEGEGSPERLDARSQSPEGASAPPGDPPAEGAETGPGPGGQGCRPCERAHPAKVLTLDIYLSKTNGAQVDDEPVVLTAGAEDWDDQDDDMDRRAGGRRSGRRRRSQKSTDSPSPDTALPPDGAARDDAVFDYEVAPNAAAENEKKVKSARAAPDGGVAAAAAAGAESKSSPGSKGQPRGEPERGKQPVLATSPTKRRGKIRVPEAVPIPSSAASPRAPAKESPPRRPSAPDSGPAAKAAAGESGEEAPRVIARELTVRSSSLLPEIKPEHKRGPLPNHHWDGGRGEGSRSKELGRSTAGPDAAAAEGWKPRNHFGAGRSTVTTKVTLPAKPKHVELNLKSPKNLESLGNEHNPLSQPVHKGNTATKISLFENKRVNSSPKHADIRGTRNTLASNKTFVGRAKLNLAKKTREMEQLEKKGSPHNVVLVKETSAETKVILPEEEILPATGSPEGRGMEGEATEDQALGPQLQHGDQRDADCPSDPVATALIPVKDHKHLGEGDSKAADSKRLVLENSTETVQPIPSILDTRDSPSATPKPQDPFSDSQPPAESSNQPPSLPAPVPGDMPKDACAEAPLSSFPCPDLNVSENHRGCILPVSHLDHENMPPSKLGARRERGGGGGEGGEVSSPLSTEHSPEVVGTESPSKVLVQVRSFVLPVESTQDVSSQIISNGSEVREVQLPSCHNNELEVVSVVSCAPQKEEVLSNKSTSPKHVHHKEEHAAKSGPQVMPPESEKILPSQAQSQGDGALLAAESSPTHSPGGRNHLETPQRPDQNVVNGQDSPASRLNVSGGSDDSVLDSSSDMEKFTEIIKKIDSNACVPQKKKKARVPNSPTPHFVMPPIHEDHLEKVLDPNVFTFGLGKKKGSQPEMSQALQLMPNVDPKSTPRSKRISTEQSILFKSLHAHANGKDGPLVNPETNDKENREVPNGGVKRSRLEKSALFSSMLSSLPQDKIFSPSVTSVNAMTTTFSSSQNTSLSRSPVLLPVAEGAPPSSSEKEQPHLPPNNFLKVFNFDSSNASHSGLKSPSYMEKYLQKEESKKDLDSRSNLHLPETKFSEFSKPKIGDDVEKANHVDSALKPNLPSFGDSDTDFMGLFKSRRFDPNISFSGMPLSDPTTLRGSVQTKINPRPGKVVIYKEPEVSEECIEVFSDTGDCSSWSLSPVVLVKVVRGCWILYEKPNFEGHSIPLEEGELELAGLWGIDEILERKEEEESPKPVVIGSIRHVVQDYRVSHIDLFTEQEGLGVMSSYFDDTEEMQGFGVMQKTCSMKVHWGTWLVYEEPGFLGVPFVLEPGEYPDLSFWNTEVAYIGSMRPLKMGGRKVEFPVDPKVVIYEKPFFEGKRMELETEMYNFVMEGGEAEETDGEASLPLTSVGSMKVLRGIWVAYEKSGFTGHQYLLEEGEYKDWKDWGGYDGELQSLRPILGDFSNAHMIMYSEKNFGSKGSSIDVLGIVANLMETGYGVKTQSINVLSGVWVAYENPDFTGEQYILDKGFYTSFEDWGGKNCKISSVQPICLDSFSGLRRRNQIHLFSEPQFQGHSRCFEETTGQIDDSFSTKSCRVLGGSWVAYDGENFSGNQYVLEEGHYPCLSAMGCLPGASVKSLRFIDVEFSEPTIILFEREDFKGKKIELNAEAVNLQSLGFNTQIRSVQVIGGIWITYEYGNYRGRQFLLSPAEVPNWYEFSGCRQIGSLRPFNQKRIYFRLRNKATGLFLSTNGNLEDLKLLRIQVTEDVGADDQIWIYQEGCIKCRIAEDCCMTIVGSLVTSGSKLGLALDQSAESQFWSMKSDGRIYSKLKPNLVLDIKGGAQYDQNHIILNTASKEKLTQVWEAMVL